MYCRWELARFAHGGEANAHFVGQGHTEHEPARFNPNDVVGGVGGDLLGKPVNAVLQAGGVGQHGRDVAKQDAGFRKIGNIADVGF